MPAFPVSVPNVVSAWGKARHFLSTGQPLLGEFQANNERANITTTKPGGGAARRGRWLEQRVAVKYSPRWQGENQYTPGGYCEI